MRTFSRILNDIKRGENIDLYVTVVAAIVLAAMNVLNLLPDKALTSVTLAILALITFTILGNRHRLEQVSENTSLLMRQAQFLEEYPPGFISQLEAAKDIWLIGTHHSSTLTAHYTLFERKVRQGGKLRALLIDPEGSAYKMSAMRFPGKVSPSHEQIRILSSLDSLNELQSIAPDKVEIRTLDFLFDYSAVLLDSDRPSATIFLERNTFKISGGRRKPKFVYRQQDGRWFEHINAEIEELWKNSVPWYKQSLQPVASVSEKFPSTPLQEPVSIEKVPLSNATE